MSLRTEKDIMFGKLDAMINKRRESIGDAIEKIQNDGTLLNDFVAPTAAINFSRDESDIIANFQGGTGLRFTDHSFGQLSDKFGVPVKYMRKMRHGQQWERDLAVNILNEHAQNINRERVLIREVNGNIRGFLSDSYRRLNTAGIFTAFLMAAQNKGAALVDAYGGDVDFIEVVSPEIIEIPTENNGTMYTVFGARLRNSNVGKASLQMNTFAVNLICTNGMTGSRVLREMHLGKRLPDNITLSQTTMIKDTEAMASLVGDVMTQIFDPGTIQEHRTTFIKASDIVVDMSNEVKALPKIGFTLSEAEAVSRVLQNGDDSDGIQGRPTLLKLTQAMTAVARDTDNKERARGLEDLAGQMLTSRVK